MVDLGNWMAGSYVMSRPVDPDRDGEAIERAAATVAEDSPDIEH